MFITIAKCCKNIFEKKHNGKEKIFVDWKTMMFWVICIGRLYTHST